MPTQVQGFSAEEERALDEMRKKSLKQLELLRLRQVQYKTRRNDSFQGSAKDVQNTGSSFGMTSDIKAQTKNGIEYKKHQLQLSEDNGSVSVDKSRYLSDASKDSGTHPIVQSTLSKDLHFSRIMPNEASGSFDTNRDMQDAMSISLKQRSKPSVYADSFYNHSYENSKHYDWPLHMGAGDSQDNEFSLKDDYSNIADRSRNLDHGDVDGLAREIQHHPQIETEQLESDDDFVTDVITIADSPPDRTLNARSRMAAISSNSLRNGEFNQTHSARELEFDLRNSRSESFHSHDDVRDLSHVDVEERFVGSASPHQTSSLEGTPKSILRHRKMIDDNVRVESKYEHTPTKSRSRRRRELNFSYSDVVDPDSVVLKSKSVNFSDSIESSDQQEQENRGNLNQHTSKSKLSPDKDKTKSDRVEAKLRSLRLNKDVSSKMPSQKFAVPNESRYRSKKPHYVTPTDGSYTEELDLEEIGARNSRKVENISEKKSIQVGVEVPSDRDVSRRAEHSDSQANKVKEVVQKNLLMHSGNDRKNASIVRELESRPKSVIFDAGKGAETKGNESFLSKSYLDHPSTREFSRLMDDRHGKPLLGYDWIAGLLDNEEVRDLSGQPDDLFEQVKEFRRQNKHECTGTSRVLTDIDVGRPITPEVQNPMHTCIHGYSVNERLFTEPVNVDNKGTSFCPVCLSTRRDPSQDSPGFVRVSIPRSTLESPYKIKPHRRRSFDPIDSCALSQHCLAGYECSRPSSIATATNLDLKHAAHGIKSQLITTEEEARKIADSVSKTSQHRLPKPLLLPNVSIPRIGQESNSAGDTLTLQSVSSQPSLSMSRSSTRDSRSVTDELLNTSHSFRYQLQSLEKERGVGAQSNSTVFPLY